jgi:hypothetical protein
MAYQTSQGLASLGRNGDSMLVHMNPTEVAGLQSLAMAQGGSLTINPDTGLPEAFKLGGFFKSLLPVFAGMAMPASAGLWAGIAAGAATGALTSKDKLMGAITGGLGGYSGFGLGQGLRAAAGTSSLGAVGGGSSGLATGGGYIPGATSAADLAYNSAMMAPTAGAGAATTAGNVGTSMMTDPGILNARNAAQTMTSAGAGPGSSILNSAASPAEQALSNFGSNASQLKQGFGNVISGDQAAIDAYTKGVGAKTGMGALAKTALPIGGAALGGIEPSDLYGEPINMEEAKKKQAYDPYSSLNLSGDTGLRLYAEGGTIATGGIRDLYGSSDNQNQAPLSRDGYGLGRLNQLGNQQSLSQAQTLGYAMGGPVSFEDGGGVAASDAAPMSADMATTSTAPGYADMSYDALVASGVHPMNAAGLKGMLAPSRTYTGATAGPALASSSPYGTDMASEMMRVSPDVFRYSDYGVGRGTSPYAGSAYSMIRKEMGSPGYAMGGPVSFADGGDSNKEDALGLPSLSPDMSMSPNTGANNSAMIQSVMGAMQPTQGMQGNTSMTQGQMPDQNNDSIIAKVTANLRTDPNYQPTNPIEAAIVKQIKGNDPMQQGEPSQQGLGSLAPNQPMVPSYAPSVAMGPTYFAGMNAPRGMARGGYLNGQGDGMSDSIPATIEGKQPARLADGEFVVPADVVSHIGNGSSKAGSQRLYSMLDKVRKARTGTKKQGKQIKPEKYMPA